MGKFEGDHADQRYRRYAVLFAWNSSAGECEATEYSLWRTAGSAVASFGRSQVSIMKNFDKFRVNRPVLVLNGTGSRLFHGRLYTQTHLQRPPSRKVTAQTHAKFPGLTCYVFTGERIHARARRIPGAGRSVEVDEEPDCGFFRDGPLLAQEHILRRARAAKAGAGICRRAERRFLLIRFSAPIKTP